MNREPDLPSSIKWKPCRGKPASRLLANRPLYLVYTSLYHPRQTIQIASKVRMDARARTLTGPFQINRERKATSRQAALVRKESTTQPRYAEEP